MNKWFVVVLLVGTVAFAASAQAQKRGAGKFPMQQADANGDGKVSWAEVREVAPRFTQERFNKLDRNGDGLLSKADAAGRPKGAAEKFPKGERLVAILRRADADGDDRVTRKELAAVAPQLAQRGFARLDVNKDGVITEADVKKLNGSGAPSPDAIRRADANGDGQWSYEELKTVAKQLTLQVFESADGDDDGVLNNKELQALRRLANRERSPRRGNTQSAQVRRDAIGKILESDADGNGAVTFEELAAAKPGYPRSAFDRNERNNDGILSQADLP